MFIGHYAVGVALASIRPERGAVTTLALAAVGPDLPGLALVSFVPLAMYSSHGPTSLAVIAAVMVIVTRILRLSWIHSALAVFAVATHLALDVPAQSLYARPWLDFPMEAAIAIGAAVVYARRASLESTARKRWWKITAALVAFQSVWDLMLVMFPGL